MHHDKPSELHTCKADLEHTGNWASTFGSLKHLVVNDEVDSCLFVDRFKSHVTRINIISSLPRPTRRFLLTRQYSIYSYGILHNTSQYPKSLFFCYFSLFLFSVCRFQLVSLHFDIFKFNFRFADMNYIRIKQEKLNISDGQSV